jgi:WD40 repeat protein
MTYRNCLIAMCLITNVAFAEGPVQALEIVEKLSLKDHSGVVWAAVFSPDGKHLAAATGLYNKAGEVVVWDLATKKTVFRHKEATGVRSVAYSPDGKYLIAANYYAFEVKILDATSGKVLKTVPTTPNPNNAVAFSPDGRKFAAGLLGTGVSAKLWDAGTANLLADYSGHTQGVSTIAFSPDGRFLVTGSGDKSAMVWNVETRKVTTVLTGHDGLIEYIAFSPDGRLLATASWDRTVKLWETTTWKERATLKDHKLQVLSVNFSPDSRLLVSSTGAANAPIAEVEKQPGELKVWDVRSLRAVASKGDLSDFRVWLATFSPDGKTIATSSEDDTIKLWEVRGAVAAPTRKIIPATSHDAIWADLAEVDARKAAPSLQMLHADPESAVTILKSRLKPVLVEKGLHRQIASWIEELDSDEFQQRERAVRELAKYPLLAEAPIRKVLTGKHSAEFAERARKLLERMQEPLTNPDTIRACRGIEVLEWTGSAEAQMLLKELAAGAPYARATEEARLALERTAKATRR